MRHCNINADLILSLLAEKHHRDIFVSECKTGPTQGASSCPRLDAWVMKPSWANPVTIGYEIKVSRQDFLNDNKWKTYLDFCTDFYFVAPSGVIDPKELPPEAGLMTPSTNIKRLYTKKKAVSRDVELDPYLCKYILMSRVKIQPEFIKRDNRAFWEDWLKERKINHKIGYEVSKGLKKAIDEEILNVEKENNKLKRDNERLQNVQKVLDDLGISYTGLYSYRLKDEIEQAERKVRTGVPKNLLRSIEDTISDLNKTKEIIEKLGK